MLVPVLLALAASSTVSEVELTPTQLPPPLVVAPAPTREEVSRADAARVERWLEALAGFERDQRRTAGIVALGGGAGLVLAGGWCWPTAASTIGPRRGPALLGAGGALLATGVVMYLITGKAEDLAAELAAADLEDPVRRAQAIRATEAQVVELAQEYRSVRARSTVWSCSPRARPRWCSRACSRPTPRAAMTPTCRRSWAAPAWRRWASVCTW
jgi:hypothetical protein